MITFNYLSNPFEMGSRIIEMVPHREGLRCSDLTDGEFVSFTRNGFACPPETPVADGDFVFAVRNPAGVGGYIVSALINIAISTAVSYGIRLLMPRPDGPVQGDSNKSPTYGFSRIRNVRGEGQPIPVVYGEHRTAGTIVNEFVEVNNATGKSTYFGLIAISHGPIHSIAGEDTDTDALAPLSSEADTVPNKIFLNGNPISNYSGIEAWVRLGSLEQDVVPGFERAKITYDVNVFLTQKEGDPAGGSVLTDYESADDDAIWDEYGFAWDTPEVVDGTEVILNFPRGLYRINADGETMPSPFIIAFRFAKLDENGNPLLGAGFGGNADDGWVRLLPEEFTQERLSTFQLAFPISFFNPADFVTPVPGGCIYSVEGSLWTAGAGYWRTASDLTSNRIPDEWYADKYASEYTFETWIKFDGATVEAGTPWENGSGPSWLAMHEWSSASGNGVWMGFHIWSGPYWAGNWGWYPRIQVGKFGVYQEWPRIDLGSSVPGEEVWHHIVWTHKRISSSQNRNDFYFDGQLRGSYTSNMDILTPGAPGQGANTKMNFGWSSGSNIVASTWDVHGRWDEVKVMARFVNQAYVTQSYNGGQGQRGSALNNPDLVAAYHHDVAGFADYGPFGNDGVANGTVNFKAGEGVVATTTQPARVRGRYRLQCLRANEESKAGTGNEPRREDESEWQLAVTWLDDAFSYPGVALLGVSVPATEQLNTSAPEITAVVKGKIVKVWDGVSTTNPSFVEQWSNNPAWVCTDVATNTTYGGGHAFKLGNVDWPSAQIFADRADTQVSDGRGGTEFYRQRWDQKTNWIDSPIEFEYAASGGFWATSAAVVTSDTDIAPDGSVTADTVADTSPTNLGWISAILDDLGRDPTWWCLSLFVKKDPTATTYSSGIFVQIDGDNLPIAIFTVDTGFAVQNCTVEDYSDDWWLVKMPSTYEGIDSGTVHQGINGNFSLRIIPSGYDHGTSTGNNSLQGSIVVWGATVNLGRNHVIHPPLVNQACRLFMGDRTADGTAQIPPPHWVSGAELRINSANDSSWVTPASAERGLELISIDTTGPRDGYERTWILTCSWYSGDAADAPTGTFPNLVVDGWDWSLVANGWHWAWLGDGVLTKVADTAGSGSGADDPLESDIGQVAITSSGGVKQQTPVSYHIVDDGATIRMRALVAVGPNATSADITITNPTAATSSSDSHTLNPNIWETLEVDQDADANEDISFSMNMTASAADNLWVDAVGAYQVVDASGNQAGGTIGGSEGLFQYDAVHDIFEDLWDAMISVCSTARATPMREGHKLRFKIEQPRSPVGLVGAGSIKTDGDQSTFSARWSDPSERDNSLTVDFWDRLLNWERSTVSRDDPDIETLSDAGLVRQQPFSMRGVTRRSQVTRNADYLIALNKLTIVEGTFNTGPGALPFEPGDVIAIANDIMPWGTSGRLAETHSRDANLLTAAISQDFSSWTYGTGTEVVVTPNVVASPSGDIRGDQVEVDSAGEEALTTTAAVTAVNYIYSVRVKQRSGAAVFGIRLSQSGGSTIVAEYDWGAGTLTVASGPAWTVTKITERNGWVRLGVEYQSANTNAVLIENVPERTAANYATAAIYLADAQFELDDGSDTPTTYDRPGSGLICDREVVLSGATGVSYSARVTRAETGDSETCDVLASAATYAAGDVIDIDQSQLTFLPQKHDEYAIYDDTKKFEGIVSSIDLEENLDMRIEFAQYDAAAFDGDVIDPVDIFTSTGGGGSLPNNNSRDDQIIPNDPLWIDAVESMIPANSGLSEQWVEVRWGHDPESIRRVKETRVYVAKVDDESLGYGAVNLAGIAAGTTESLAVRVPSQVLGRDIRVWVQPVSFMGTRRLAEECVSFVRRMSSYPTKPNPPTSFNAHMEGDKIVFTWEHPSRSQGLIYEIRHGGPSPDGGWVLAQVVGETEENRLGPTSWWATAGNSRVYYYIRSRNRHGVYSDVKRIQYGARVLNATVLNSTNHWYAYASQHWHNYADGWVTDAASPPFDPVLVNMTRQADGSLRMDATELSGTYKTASVVSGTQPDHFQHEEWCYLEAVVIATCMNVREVGDGNLNTDGSSKFDTYPGEQQIGWPFQGNVTVEGDLQGDLPRIRIQMKLIRGNTTGPLVSTDTDAGGNDGWLDYRPGIYPCHGAQFKLRVTRPRAEWDVRISEFSTQAARVPSSRHYRTPMERMISEELNLG